MPQVASIVLANGEVAPVNHTFNPIGQDAKTGIWWFEDQSPRVTATTSLGWPRIGIRVKREAEVVQGQSSKNQITRIELTIALPQLEVLGTSSTGFTPAPQVAYVDRSQHTFMLSSRDAIADRKDALSFAKNLLANSQVVDIVTNLTSLY
jgi:hypothetical protein